MIIRSPKTPLWIGLVLSLVLLISCAGTPAPTPTIPSTNANHGSAATNQAVEPAESFDDDAVQPPSIYKASIDKTIFAAVLESNSLLENKVEERVKMTPPIGVMENPIGSNRGPEVDAYLKFCSVTPPAWWCAAFVSYQIHQAAKEISITPKWPKFASCEDIFNWGINHHLIMDQPIVPSVMLIPGDKSKGERAYKHTGIVIAYDSSTSTITTVEGNSNNDGSSNGIGVFSLNRRIKPGMKFVKII